jgi:hypothetical protein
MVKFHKDVVEDPVEELGNVSIPNEEREGPVVGLLDALMQSDNDDSYHNQDPKRAHPSSADSCQRRNYLKYVHKLDDELEVPDNDSNTNWTFTHGDLIHELIQDLLVQKLGEKHVSVEESVSYDFSDEYYIYGHADLIIRGLEDPDELRNVFSAGVDLIPENFKGFPDPFIIDIKTKSEFTYYNRGKGGHARSIPKTDNMKQLNTYMGIVGAKFGCLLYYSKRNDHLEEYWVEFDQELFNEVMEQHEQLLDFVNTGTPAPKNPDGDYMCKKFCKWYDQGECPGMEGVEPSDEWDGEEDAFVYDHPPWA